MQIRQSKNLGLALATFGLAAVVAARAQRSRRGYSFTGRSVVITGGSRGLGLVLARQLAAEGARLMLIARDQTELERAVQNIHRHHPSAEVATVHHSMIGAKRLRSLPAKPGTRTVIHSCCPPNA